MTWAFYCDNGEPRCTGQRSEPDRSMQIEDDSEERTVPDGQRSSPGLGEQHMCLG